MTEYEYSFEVKDVKPFIKFCEIYGYTLLEDCSQTRILYRNKNKTLARITINNKNGIIKKSLDFKDDVMGDDKSALERKESLALEFSDEVAVDSILEFLDYYKDITLERNRKTFEKGNVKFEIDNYISPSKKFVVAIEGEKSAVDQVYEIIKKYI